MSPLSAATPTYLWTQCLVEEWVRQGVTVFFVAPGSRSTPLTVAAARHPEARTVLHVDERGTAFAALGYGRATGRPAAWITTSGTAVANALPAVVEAATDGVPMLLLTADRPPELRDTGANQTVDQVKIFGDYTRWQFDLPTPTADVDPAFVLTTAAQAVHRSLRVPKGPVHLNCMFRKPLEPQDDGPDNGPPMDVPSAVREWADLETPFTTYPTPTPTPDSGALDTLADAVAGTPRGLITVGRLDTDAEADAARRLAAHLGWPLLPDVTSRLRLGPVAGAARIAYADALLASDAFREEWDPDAVVHLGGRHVSKRLRHFLRDAEPLVHAVIRPDPSRIDPDHRVTHHLESGVAAAAAGLVARLDPASARRTATDYRTAWTRADAAAERTLATQLSETPPLTEPGLARQLSRLVPPDHLWVTASSMPVRDVHRYAAPDGDGVPVLANRGASGIDGTVATAAGAAHGHGGPVTLLIGDLALWHDLNSLALLREVPVVVVVVNNDGGGIFHFLPIREHADVFDPYFTTPHGRTFQHAAATFGLPYANPTTPAGFAEAYRAATQSGASALLEVETDRDANRALHEALSADIVKALRDA